MRKMINNEDTIVGAIQQIGLSPHEANVLFDGCGCIEDIAACSVEDLLDKTSLENSTIKDIVKLMNED